MSKVLLPAVEQDGLIVLGEVTEASLRQTVGMAVMGAIIADGGDDTRARGIAAAGVGAVSALFASEKGTTA